MLFKIPERLINMMILMITTGLCLIIFEISLRLIYGYGYLDHPLMYRKFHQYDPEVGVVLSPNRKGMFRTAEGDRLYYVSINSDGFRGDEIVDRESPKIAVLGDSYIFGYGIDQKDVFSEILSSMTNLDVVNFGVSGTSIDQMYLLLKRYITTFTFSDVVIYISPNDFEDLLQNSRYGIDSPHLVKTDETYEFRFPEKPWSNQCRYIDSLDQVICESQPLKLRAKLFLKQFLLAYVLRFQRLPPDIRGEQKHDKAFLQSFSYKDLDNRLQTLSLSERNTLFSETSQPLPEKMKRMDWVLQKFLELADEYQFRFHVIYDDIHEAEEAYLEQRYCPGKNCIDFGRYRQEFLEQYPDEQLMCQRNPHWNEIGHRLFAYVLYNKLFKKPVGYQDKF